MEKGNLRGRCTEVEGELTPFSFDIPLFFCFADPPSSRKSRRRLSRDSNQPPRATMDVLNVLITKTLPTYLASVPIPIDGAALEALSGDEVNRLAVFSFASATLSALVLVGLLSMCRKTTTKVNTTQDQAADKIVHTCSVQDVEDLGRNVVYCRCWKSSKFPLCDGSHNKHNTLTGDNVGPLIISPSQ